MIRKVFTVEEANALVPALEAVFSRIERHKDEMRERYRKIQVLEALWGEKLGQPENPDHQEFTEHRDALEEAVQAIGRLVEEEILGQGIRFPQGGLEHGLLDFPTTVDGRWVYLCWRAGEPEVGAWHEVDAGFAGRQPITPDLAQRMGRETDTTGLGDNALDF
jgi:hypothetical protein